MSKLFQNVDADMRIDYRRATLGDAEVAATPMQQFGRWYDDVLNTNILEANAMTIATVDENNEPNARMVLMKDHGPNGIVFYTHYTSQKGQELAQNNHAAAVFYWPSRERQVRFRGTISKLSSEVSDEYFHMRPRGSQIGAAASPQSEIVKNRQWLDDRYNDFVEKAADAQIKRPETWGGYLLTPTSVEFWQGRSNRMHDRLRYNLADDGEWHLVRLAP